MASVVGGMSNVELESSPDQPAFAIKSEPQEFSLPYIPPDDVGPNSFNCLVSENWMPVKVESPDEEAVPTPVCVDQLGGSATATTKLDSRKKSVPWEVRKKKFKRIIENPHGEACLRRKMRQIVNKAAVQVNLRMLAAHEKSSRKRRGKYVASLTKSPGRKSGEKKKREAQKKTKREVKSKAKRCVKKKTRKAVKKKNEKESVKCQESKAKMVPTGNKHRIRLTYAYRTNANYFRPVYDNPEAEERAENIVNKSSLVVLADLSILNNQPKVMLTRCQVPEPELEPRPSTSRSNYETETAVKPTPVQKLARSLNVQWRSIAKRGCTAQGVIIPGGTRERRDICKDENFPFKKVIEDPKKEAKADKIFSRFREFVTVRKVAVPSYKLPQGAKESTWWDQRKPRKLRKVSSLLSSSPSTSCSDEDWTESSNCESSTASSDEPEAEPLPKARRTTHPLNATRLRDMPGAAPVPGQAEFGIQTIPSATTSLIVKPEPSENPSSLSALPVFANSCHQHWENRPNGECGEETARMKSEPLEYSSLPALHNSSLANPCHPYLVNFPTDERIEEQTIRVKEEPPDPDIEEVPSTFVAEEQNSNTDSTIVCNSSELNKTQSHKKRDSDIMMFCQKIIDDSSLEVRFSDDDDDTVVNNMSSSFCYEDDKNMKLPNGGGNEEQSTSMEEAPSDTEEKSPTSAPEELDPNTDSAVVCNGSELNRTMRYRTRDSDIMLFCKKIIENASAEARFEDIVNKMSSRFCYEGTSSCLQSHQE